MNTAPISPRTNLSCIGEHSLERKGLSSESTPKHGKPGGMRYYLNEYPLLSKTYYIEDYLNILYDVSPKPLLT
jgi:hypothetical protein